MRLKTLKQGLQSLPTKLRGLPPAPTTERLRGSSGMARLRRLRQRDPMCVKCRAEGIVERAMQYDHTVPLWKGGPDTEANMQGLCKVHHDAKSEAEARERAALRR